jgi:hypothetical protein
MALPLYALSAPQCLIVSLAGKRWVGTAFGERKAIELSPRLTAPASRPPGAHDPPAACSSPPGRDEAERQPAVHVAAG